MKNNNVFKIILALIMTISNFLGLINVNAKSLDELKDQVTVVVEDEVAAIAGNEIVTHMRYTSEGDYIYCVQRNKWELYTGDKLTLDTELDDAGILYLLKNGYPNKTILDGGRKDYYITQLAIWFYYQEVSDIKFFPVEEKLGGKYAEHPVAQAILKLYQDSVAAHNKGKTDPSMKVTKAGSELHLSEDGKYLESDYTTVKLVGMNSYKVKVNDNKYDATIVDEKGNTVSSLKSGNKFKVRILITDEIESIENLEVSINSTATIDKVFRYKPENEKKQKVSVATLFSENKDFSDKLVFNYKFETPTVEISKVDATNGKELPGAHLEVRDEKGNVIESWISSEEVHKFSIQPGKYTLKETIAPDGYKLSEETIEFEVKNNGVVTKVTMKNSPKEVPVAEISKVDATNGKELPGAHLEVRDEKGNLIESWVSSEEVHKFNIQPGKYTLTETIAPDGYKLSEETISFEVKDDGTVTKVTMKNSPKEVPVVEISKVDATNGKELPGAHLEVRDEKGNLIESWVSSEEVHKFNIQPGKYTLKETIAPDGYELSEETIEFEVKDDGIVTKVTMKNQPYIDVPVTSLNASSMVVVLGSIISVMGLGVIYKYGKKPC